jgi:hypothetical protein
MDYENKLDKITTSFFNIIIVIKIKNDMLRYHCVINQISQILNNDSMIEKELISSIYHEKSGNLPSVYVMENLCFALPHLS